MKTDFVLKKATKEELAHAVEENVIAILRSMVQVLDGENENVGAMVPTFLSSNKNKCYHVRVQLSQRRIIMIYLIWLLRIIHIVAGVFWVGGTLIMAFFVGPAVGALGEPGQKFAGHLMNNLKFSNRMAIASGLTILAGGILYGLDARAGEAWLRSNFAIGLGIGAAFALVGFVFGILIGRNTKAMAELGSKMQGQPSSAQLAEMQALQKRQATVSMISAWSVILATVFMAIARYL